ncbi:hypothetical protein HYX12_01695, partial [Candidatus Woesearchaeota archaeon]|nr:hypothetical protein [Candidatus Woesearchaeota archaeon]
MFDFRQRAESHYRNSPDEIEDIERILSYLKDMKNILIALEDKSISHDDKRKSGMSLLLEKIIERISQLTGEELRFFLTEKEAKSFKSLVDDFKRSFDDDFRKRLRKGVPEYAGKFGKDWIRNLKERITIIENQQEKMESLLKDAKFQAEMEKKARALGKKRPQLSSHLKGCFHGFPEQKLLSIFGSGIASNIFS